MKGHGWAYNSDHMAGEYVLWELIPSINFTQTYQMTVSVQNSGLPFYINRTANDYDGNSIGECELIHHLH